MGKSTRMDKQGRIFLPRLLQQWLGFQGSGTLEFIVEDDGTVSIGKGASQSPKDRRRHD